MERGVQSKEELLSKLRGYVEEWLPILGLTDWNITVKITNKKNVCAQIQIRYYSRDAIIYITEFDKRDRQAPPLDYELDVVHELLHILVDNAWGTRSKLRNVAKETFIEMTARTLVGLKRGDTRAFYGKVT